MATSNSERVLDRYRVSKEMTVETMATSNYERALDYYRVFWNREARSLLAVQVHVRIDPKCHDLVWSGHATSAGDALEAGAMSLGNDLFAMNRTSISVI